MWAKLKGLRDDRGGAIMVVAVFLCTFLVGALWYMMGVGNASIYRERMQDGSDAAAFVAAVDHARYMNIIAELNAIMAALEAVLTTLQLVAFILQLIAILLLCCIVTEPLSPPVESASKWVTSIYNEAKGPVEEAMSVITKIEQVFSRVSPLIAEWNAYSTAKSYSKPVEGGIAVTNTVIHGLPLVSDSDDTKQLCAHSDELVGDIFMIPFSVVPGGSYITSVLSGPIDDLASMFCDNGGGSGSSCGGDPADEAKTSCQQQQTAANKANAADPKGKQQTVDMKKCESDATKKLQAQQESCESSESEGSGSSYAAQIIDQSSQQGNSTFQIVAFTWGDTTMVDSPQAGVQTAAWNKGLFTYFQVPFWGKIHLADAEFFWVCGGTGWKKQSLGCDNATFLAESMWTPAWSARLRRYSTQNTPGGDIIKDVIGIVTEAEAISEGLAALEQGPATFLSEASSVLGGTKSLDVIYVVNASAKPQGWDAVNRSPSGGQIIH